MKKIITILLATLMLVATMSLIACGDKKSVPNDPEVAKANLEAAGYTVEFMDEDKRTMISAHEKNDWIGIQIFYFKNEDDAKLMYSDFQEEYEEEKDDLNKMPDGPEKEEAKKILDKISFGRSGCIVFVGTSDAIDAANGK